MNEARRFRGPNGLADYLQPRGFNGEIVELPAAFNPFTGANVRISAVVLYQNPILNGKFFPASSMLKEARRSGKLDGKSKVVDASSGNMALAETILAPRYGIKETVAIVPPNIARGKKRLLEVFGATVIVDGRGIEKAKELGAQDGYRHLWQYGNYDNPAGYEKFLAPELWELTDGKMSLFAAGLGTTGTIQGVANHLRKIGAATKTLGIITAPGETISGVRTVARLEEVSFDWQKAVDFKIYVGKDDAMVLSLALSRAGLIAGPSSGFALAGLLRFIAERSGEGALDALRNADGEVDAVFVCFDTPFVYLDDYVPYTAALKERVTAYFDAIKRAD